MSPSRRQVVVIGAGIGGLVAALELAHDGYHVTVLERADGPGGKMRTVPSPAGPVDAGPTVFSLPWVFEEVFAAVGERLADHLALKPLSILARHHWRQGEWLDLFPDPAQSVDAIGHFAGARAAREFTRFSAQAKRQFDAFLHTVMMAPDPTPISVAAASWRQAPRLLPQLLPGVTLAKSLERQFTDPRLRQLFGRYATYVGGSPYRSPAILALIWQAEAAGVSALPGGIHSLATTLESLATRRGAQFHYGDGAAEIEVREGAVAGVITDSGARFAADTVVYNGDPAAVAENLLGAAAAPTVRRRPRHKRSYSAWVWTFADDPQDAPLAHHNVYFSDNSRAEFAELSALGRTPRDPTLYLCAQDTDTAAPGQPQRFQIIMNAPADGDIVTPTDQEIRQCETRVFSRLNEAGIPLTAPVAEQALTTPWDFNRLFPGSGGAIYGPNPHSMWTTFTRPRARTNLPGLYLAGGAVHPGPGVPMAALSGRMAVQAIRDDRVSTSTSRRTAMRGGMSTGSPTTASAASRSSVS